LWAIKQESEISELSEPPTEEECGVNVGRKRAATAENILAEVKNSISFDPAERQAMTDIINKVIKEK